jgi:ATP synthase F1 complex assembly factor 2
MNLTKINLKFLFQTTKASSVIQYLKSNYTTTSPRDRKRFYKEVTVNESFNEQNEIKQKYEINLDKRKLKTPNGKLVQVNNEFLASLIAHEWKSQDKFLRLSTMHLTTLLNTCIDNPLNITKEQIINSLKTYIKTDTILYRESENLELMKLQDQKWTPYVNWINDRFLELKLSVKYDLNVDDDKESENLGITQTTDTLERYLNSFDLNSLIAINFICENFKSVILSLALINRKINDIEGACDLALLETHFQTNKWGKVEWHHDFEEVEIKSRVSAALVFIYFNSNFYATKTKI